MSKVITFANHKGGVGKTTLSTNIADALAREGLDVLLVDLDPQSNATQLLYSFDDTPAVTIEKVLEGSAPAAAAIIENTRVPGVHLIGSSLKLASLERQLQLNAFSSTSIVRDKLRPVFDAYDVVILDTPPALGFLSANALAASHYAFIPIQSGSKLSLVGADDMIDFVQQGKSVNPNLEGACAILTSHDMRKKMCKISSAAVRGCYAKTLEHTLPVSTDMHKSQALGKTILQYNRDHTASKEIVGMCREIIQIVGITKSGD